MAGQFERCQGEEGEFPAIQAGIRHVNGRTGCDGFPSDQVNGHVFELQAVHGRRKLSLHGFYRHIGVFMQFFLTQRDSGMVGDDQADIQVPITGLMQRRGQ